MLGALLLFSDALSPAAAAPSGFSSQTFILDSLPLGFSLGKNGFVKQVKRQELAAGRRLRLGDRPVAINGKDVSSLKGKGLAKTLKGLAPPISIEFARPRVLDAEAAGAECSAADLPKGKTAVLYSYHMCEGDTISETWLDRLQTSAGSVRKNHPDTVILLLTNIPAANIDWQLHQLFDMIITIDLLKRSGLLPFYNRLKGAGAGGAVCRASACGTKAYALYHLWQHCNAEYEAMLYMDHDTYWMSAGAQAFFEPLAFYDVAGVMEGYAYDTAKGEDHLIDT